MLPWAMHCCDLQFKQLSNDVFDQFRTNGVLDPAVDVGFNELHHGRAVVASTLKCLLTPHGSAEAWQRAT